MRMHWMEIFGETSIEGLQKTAETLDKSQYYSTLLTYHSTIPDFWIRCARSLNLNHNFKYLFAIRTYAISPEYFVMMYRAFNEIQKNRIMFNIVSGDIQHSEDSINDIIFQKENFDTVEKRLDYTFQWISKMLELLCRYNEPKPEIVISGSSKKTLQLASDFADYNLCMLNEYKMYKEQFQKNNKRMVCAALTIRDSYEEAVKFIDQIDHKSDKQWSLFGTKEQILEEINELEKDGVTDLMVRYHKGDDYYYLIHDFIKEYNEFIKKKKD